MNNTTLKQEICELQNCLNASSCASAVSSTVNRYSRFGKQALNNAKNVWKSAMAGRLPDDVVDLLERESFPKFDRLETGHMPLTNIFITQVVAEWHRKLFNILDRFCQGEIHHKVLCGFNVVDDLIFYLTSARDFQAFWAALGRPTPGNPQRKPHDVNDALACLISVINDPSKQGKFSPDPATLAEIRRAAVQANLRSERFLGGAAGNMAYILSQMGMEVHIHCPYHSDQLRWGEMASSARYLQFNHNQYQLIQTNPGTSNLPYKSTVGFQIVPGWTFSHLNVQATQAGRVLFIGRYPTLAPQQRRWNGAQVNWQGQRNLWNGPWDNDRAVWPHPTVLGHHQIVGQDLNIFPADAPLIQQWATNERYNVALIKDVGSKLGQDQLEQARMSQTDSLRRSRIPIHVEISPRHNLAFLRHLISSSPYGKASYWSAGLNPDELLDITDRNAKAWDYHGFSLDAYLFPESRTSESLLKRFVRVLHLLRELELDWIYVHGNELDIAIWRKEASGLIEQLGPNKTS